MSPANGKGIIKHGQLKKPKFILTNLGTLPQALAAYKLPMEIEEMFLPSQTGGDNEWGDRVNRRPTN